MNNFDLPEDRVVLTKEEADQLIRLHGEQVHPADIALTTADVAEVLQIPDRQVREMLRKLRSGAGSEFIREVASAKTAKSKSSPIALRRQIIFAMLMAVAVAIGIFLLTLASQSPQTTVEPPQLVRTVPAATPVKLFALSIDNVRPTSAGYGIDAEGQRQILDAVRKQAAQKIPTLRHVSGSEASDTLGAIDRGLWDAKGIEFLHLELIDHNSQVVSRYSIPIYSGDDAMVTSRVRTEQDLRVKQLAEKAAEFNSTP